MIVAIDSFGCRSDFNVVHPLAIELPRSLGIVVTNWNLPMHLFLKECESHLILKYILICVPDYQSII